MTGATVERRGLSLDRYRAVLALPHVGRVFATAFLGRLPIGMYTLASVLLLSKATGSYAIAGGATAAFAIGGGVTAPIIGRLIDRLGQTSVLVSCAIAFPAAVAALIVVADAAPRTVPILACAAAAGITFPPLFATLRTLVPALAGALTETAFALEAVLQELLFVFGPLVVALIVAISSPKAALAASAALAGVGTLAFAATPPSRAWRPEAKPQASSAGALASSGIRTLVIMSVVDGMTFGTLEVALPAFAQSEGSAGTAGLLLGTVALGSAAGGLWYGAREWRRDPADLLVLFAIPFAAGLAPLALASSIPVMALLLLLAGLSIAPSAAASFALIGRLAPAGTMTEAFTWLSAGVIAGFAVGGALSGVLVEGVSIDAALLATAGFAAVAAAALWVRRETLRGRETLGGG